MTETAAAQPTLIHAGTYAMYETPTGGRHIVYKRTSGYDPEAGEVRGIVECPDLHLPDIPAEALPLIESWLENGFPPQVLAMLSGKLNPLALARQVGAMVKNGGSDGVG